MRLPWRNHGREAERFAQRVEDVQGGAHDVDGGVATDEVDDVEPGQHTTAAVIAAINIISTVATRAISRKKVGVHEQVAAA
jgi:hypothetical protein